MASRPPPRLAAGLFAGAATAGALAFAFAAATDIANGSASWLSMLAWALPSALNAAFYGLLNLLIIGGLIWLILGKFERRSRFAFVAAMIVANLFVTVPLAYLGDLLTPDPPGIATGEKLRSYLMVVVPNVVIAAAMAWVAWAVAHRPKAIESPPSTS